MLFLMESRIDPDLLISGEFNLKALRAVIEGKLRSMNADRIVIDALDMIMRVFEDEKRRQNEFFALNKWLKEKKITAVLTSKNLVTFKSVGTLLSEWWKGKIFLMAIIIGSNGSEQEGIMCENGQF